MSFITRKEFLSRMWGILLLPYLLFLVLMTRRHVMVAMPPDLRIAPTIPEGVTFIGEVIVTKQGDKISIFSDRCTHLGCKINHYENDMLVCPCHGSSYTLDGDVDRGPALNGLKRLNYDRDSQNGDIIIHL